MATLDLKAPGAGPSAIMRGLAAAGDVIRDSGMSLDVLLAGKLLADEHRAGLRQLLPSDWHWRADEVFQRAERAALDASCCSEFARRQGALLIVPSKGPASFLD